MPSTRDEARAATAAPPARLFSGVDGRAVALFAAAAVVLLAPWSGYGRVFRVLFSGYGNAVLAVTGAAAPAEPEFQSTAPEAGLGSDGGATSAWTVWIRATRGAHAGDPPLPLDTRILGYVPLALLVALTLATASPWRRRASVLAIGACLLSGRVAVAIVLAVGRALAVRREAAGPLSEIVWYVLVDVPAMTYAAPLAAWAAGLALTDRGARR